MNKLTVFILVLLVSLPLYSQLTQTVCKGLTKTYSVNNTAGSSYAWSVTGSGYAGTITGNLTHSIAINWGSTPAGTYTLTVLETNSSGCSGTPQTLTVTIKDNPVIAAPNVEVCAGLTTTISANVDPSPSGGTYSWTYPSGFTNPGNVDSFSSGVGGNYTVTYTDTDTCVSNTATASVTVNPLPSATISPLTSASTTFCLGGSVVLSAPSTAGLTYVWRNAGSSIGVTTGTYTASAAGSYTVQTTDVKGCTSTTATPTVVTVNSLPTISVNAGGPTQFCQGSNVVLTAIGAGTTAPYTYQWKNAGGNLTATTTYTATTTENYSVVVTDSNTCSATSSPTTVTVRSNPAAVITASGANPFCAGNNLTLTVGAGTGFTYQWMTSSTNIPSATSNSYTVSSSSGDPTSSIPYTVKVVDGNFSTNCATTSIPVTVNINALPTTSSITF